MVKNDSTIKRVNILFFILSKLRLVDEKLYFSIVIEIYENNFTQNNLKYTITYSIFYNLTISGSLTRWPCAQSSEYI